VVFMRQLKTNKFPTTLTGNPAVFTTGDYVVFQFNDSGTIGWS
jgi:hypothetical protein